jgi:hypothetical protein
MLIARWLVLLAGLSACVCAALYLLTRNRVFWVAAKRICLFNVVAGLIFFGVLIAERLGIL